MSTTWASRHLAAPPSRVYRALLHEVASWRFPASTTCRVHELDPVEGGSVRVSLTHPQGVAGKTSGSTDTYRGRFTRLVPDRLVVEVDAFETDDPALVGEMTMTVELHEAPAGGTDLVACHDGVPDAVDPELNAQGWAEALDRLAALVEDGPVAPTSHPEPPFAGDADDALLGALERQRATFAWKCAGLDAGGLRATLGPSAMTLGGLLLHLALVEDVVLQDKFAGRELHAPWHRLDWSAGPDAEWRGAATWPDDLLDTWSQAVARSRAVVAEALRQDGLDTRSRKDWPGAPEVPTLRRLLTDLLEEYGRHVGHADLLREAVDGLVGEDPDLPPRQVTRLRAPAPPADRSPGRP